MIPARYSASRFPGKLMKDLNGESVILRTYHATQATNLFDDVFVVTDSEIIFNEIVNHGGKAIMSKKEHECGSDRIAEAVEFMDVDIVVNVQGDEPFTEVESLRKLINVFKDDDDKQIDLASLMVHITNEDEIKNYDGVLWPGCNLTVYHNHDERVVKMVDLCKVAYEVGVPQFGSCWAAQIAVYAAG